MRPSIPTTVTVVTVVPTTVTVIEREIDIVVVGRRHHRRPFPTVNPKSLHFYVPDYPGPVLYQTTPDPRVLPGRYTDESRVVHKF